jgi:hypothetical protein
MNYRIYSYNEIYSLALRVSYDYLNYFENQKNPSIPN